MTVSVILTLFCHSDESQNLPILFLKLKMEKQAVVYIMGNDRPTLYIGVTADFYYRISQPNIKRSWLKALLKSIILASFFILKFLTI